MILAATRDAARLFLELGTVTVVLAVGARLAARTGFCPGRRLLLSVFGPLSFASRSPVAPNAQACLCVYGRPGTVLVGERSFETAAFGVLPRDLVLLAVNLPVEGGAESG